MVRCSVAFSLLLIVGAAAAAEATFGPHPRLHQAFPEAFADGAPDPGSDAARERWAGLARQAQKILDQGIEVPEEGGQWVFYYACPEHNTTLQLKDGKHTCPKCGKVYADERTRLAWVSHQHNAVDRQLLVLAQAWYVTREAAFAREVYRVLKRYAELHPTWQRHDRWGRFGLMAVIGGKRFCQSLSDAYGVIQLAKAYDLVYDFPELTAADRHQIERDFFRDTVTSIYAFYLVYQGRNNHMTWYNGAVAAVGAVIGDQSLLDRAWAGSKGLDYQLGASVTADGFWYEGTVSYHYYALQAIEEHVRAMQAVGIDVSADPRLLLLYRAPLKMAYPNGQFPAINDGDRTYLRNYRQLYQRVTDLFTDTVVQQFANSGQLDALPSEVLTGAGLAYLRRGSGDDAVTVVVDYGIHGDHHGHPDKLNLMLYALGQEVFLDPGRLTYRCPEYESWTRQTVAHNTVVIDQQSQQPDTGKLICFERGELCDHLVAESTGAYKGVTLRRAVVLFDQALVDLFYVKAPGHTCDWLLHSTRPLAASPVAEELAAPLHDAAGYQHLAGLHRGTLQPSTSVTWQISDQRSLTTHFALTEQTTCITGTGIGYQLDQRLPFVLLRRQPQAATVFAVVHDLSGSGQAVELHNTVSAADSLTLTLRVAGVELAVAWDLAAELSVSRR